MAFKEFHEDTIKQINDPKITVELMTKNMISFLELAEKLINVYINFSFSTLTG